MSEDSAEYKVQAKPLGVSEKVGGILDNIKQRGLKDITDPNVWKAYKQWVDIEKNGIHLAPEDIISFAQQVVYRMVMCPECVSAGKCVACSCAIPQTMCCAAAVCKMGRWNEMMDPDEWAEFFQKNFAFAVINKPI